MKHIWFAKGVTLDYKARLVLSLLCYRAHQGGAESARSIATRLKVDAKDFVKPALASLAARSLVRQEGGKWLAVPLPPALYVARSGGKEWHQRYRFFKVEIPCNKKQVTTLQAVLYGLVRHLSRRYDWTFSLGSIASILGITKPVAEYNLKKLIAVGLLVKEMIGKGRFFIKPAVRTEEQNTWFGTVTKKRKEKAAVISVDEEILPPIVAGKKAWCHKQYRELRKLGRGMSVIRATHIIIWMDDWRANLGDAILPDDKLRELIFLSKEKCPNADYSSYLWAAIVDYVVRRCGGSKADYDKFRVME